MRPRPGVLGVRTPTQEFGHVTRSVVGPGWRCSRFTNEDAVALEGRGKPEVTC